MTIREEGYAEGYRDGYSKRDGEIVRCKDCEYWRTNTQFCTRWSAPFATQHTSPNWYCADAERKEGDGDAVD